MTDSPAPLTVLIVEDSPTIAALLQTMVELDGHQARVVARDFHALCQATHPAWDDVDVLLSDLMLEETGSGQPVSGLDILSCARQHHPRVRRIALTAAGDELYTEASRLADAVLPKPSEVDVILRALRP